MKETLRIFFDRLLGLSTNTEIRTSPTEDTGEKHFISSVRLTRSPFFIAHLVAYAVLYIGLRILQVYVQHKGLMVSIGELGFASIIFVVSLLLFPVYVRRAHDLGWSFKKAFIFSVLPAGIRVCLLLLPLLTVKNPEIFIPLVRVLPYIGIVYWILGQVQVVFMSVMIFAPGTDTHNRFGTDIKSSFTFQNLYGFSLFSLFKKFSSKTSNSQSRM